MKSVLILVFLVSMVVSRPQDDPGFARVEVRDADGQYSYQYKTGSGTVVQEQGALKRSSDGKSNIVVSKGLYKYTSPEGQQVSVEYTADERGFVPSGNAIPKEPETAAVESAK